MHSFSVWHWLIFLSVYLVAVAFPIAKIFSRAGWTPWLALLSIVPFANFILLWVFAFSPWPAVERK